MQMGIGSENRSRAYIQWHFGIYFFMSFLQYPLRSLQVTQGDFDLSHFGYPINVDYRNH